MMTIYGDEAMFKLKLWLDLARYQRDGREMIEIENKWMARAAEEGK